MKAQAWWSLRDENRIRILFADRSLATYFVSDGAFRSRKCLEEPEYPEYHFLGFVAGAQFYPRHILGGRYDLHLPIVSFTIPDALHARISLCETAALERNNELCNISGESYSQQERAMREHDEQELYHTLEELHSCMMQTLRKKGKTLQRSAPPVPEEYKRRQNALSASYLEKFRAR